MSPLFVAVFLSAPVFSGPPAVVSPPPHVDGTFAIELTRGASRAAHLHRAGAAGARGTGIAAIDAAAARFQATLTPEFQGESPPPPGSTATDFSAFQLVRLTAGAMIEALATFARIPEVAAVRRIPLGVAAAVPTDSLWFRAWHLDQPGGADIDALAAWDVDRGDGSGVIAIIDSGILPYHPDLGGTVAGATGNLWVNVAERTGEPGVDDDFNGFVDDHAGWDFVANPDGYTVPSPGEDGWDVDNDPNDFVGHGTIVAGIAGALPDNGIGTAGVGWDIRLMPLRVVWSAIGYATGITTMSYIAQAVRYATRMRADAINISLSTVSYPALDLAVADALAQGVNVVVAAGNNSTPCWISLNPGVITVAATDRADVVPIWSNRSQFVDLAAPGVELPSTVLRRPGTDSLGLRQPGYVPDASGTSFAAPVVAAAATMTTMHRGRLGLPGLSPERTLALLTHSTDGIASANPGIAGYGSGRLNLARALDRAGRLRTRAIGGSSVGPGATFTTGDGRTRIALARSDDFLVLLDATTLEVLREARVPRLPRYGVVAGDLGAPHGLGLFLALDGGSVYGFGADGALLPGWPRSAGGAPTSVYPTPPALGDLDGDGALEVIAATTDGRLWCWRADGTPLPGAPFALPAGVTLATAPALGDLDGLPGVEIIVIATDGSAHALRGDGTSVPGWPVSTGVYNPASPVIAQGGGASRVVIVSLTSIVGLSAGGAELFRVPRTEARIAHDPALGDLDGDGTDELVVTSVSGVECYTLDGLPFAPGAWPFSAPGLVLGPPLLGHLPGGRNRRDPRSLCLRPAGPRRPGTAGRRHQPAARGHPLPLDRGLRGAIVDARPGRRHRPRRVLPLRSGAELVVRGAPALADAAGQLRPHRQSRLRTRRNRRRHPGVAGGGGPARRDARRLHRPPGLDRSVG